MSLKKLCIVGTGNMGEAIIKGLARQKKFSVYICEKNNQRLNYVTEQYNVQKLSLEEAAGVCEVIVICVKPQDINSLLSVLNNKITDKHLIISIAAGISTEYIQKFFQAGVAVVRVMPNLPALIGQGITAYCVGKFADIQAGKITELIFSGLGQVRSFPEAKLNAVTAVSGSGPGFVAYFVESMIKAAQKAGFNRIDAEQLCLETLKGTTALLIEGKLNPDDLISGVCSKRGTTEAGLNVLKTQGFSQIVEQTIIAAVTRAKELSKE